MSMDKKMLLSYRFLEHGAFYAILALAFIMFIQILYEIPEYITAFLGLAFIICSFIASLRSMHK